MFVGDVCPLEVFDRPCVRSLARIRRSDRMSNVEVRNLALCASFENTISALENYWALLVGPRVVHGEHSSNMPPLFPVPPTERKKPFGVHYMT